MFAPKANDWANLVRRRREALGLTQADLAAQVGMSRQWISRFEGGAAAAARLDNALELLAALDLDAQIDEAPRA